MNVLRPYLLLACVAFTIGFVGYWALGRPVAPPAGPPASWDGSVSTPVTEPYDWNPAKRI